MDKEEKQRLYRDKKLLEKLQEIKLYIKENGRIYDRFHISLIVNINNLEERFLYYYDFESINDILTVHGKFKEIKESNEEDEVKYKRLKIYLENLYSINFRENPYRSNIEILKKMDKKVDF